MYGIFFFIYSDISTKDSSTLARTWIKLLLPSSDILNKLLLPRIYIKSLELKILISILSLPTLFQYESLSQIFANPSNYPMEIVNKNCIVNGHLWGEKSEFLSFKTNYLSRLDEWFIPVDILFLFLNSFSRSFNAFFNLFRI